MIAFIISTILINNLLEWIYYKFLLGKTLQQELVQLFYKMKLCIN